jgi:hypothetical protein
MTFYNVVTLLSVLVVFAVAAIRFRLTFDAIKKAHRPGDNVKRAAKSLGRCVALFLLALVVQNIIVPPITDKELSTWPSVLILMFGWVYYGAIIAHSWRDRLRQRQ